MSDTWKARLDGALRRGEVAGLYFTTALLVVVEFCFVCWLNRIPIPDVPTAGAGFIVLPPWYRKPRFEVTLLLTILAGLLFSFAGDSGSCGKRETTRNRGRRPFSRSNNGSGRQHPSPP